MGHELVDVLPVLRPEAPTHARTDLERYLAEKQYLAGNAFTMGDIPLGCHVQLWMRLPIERPAQPNLKAWFERLCQRPAFKKIVDIPLS